MSVMTDQYFEIYEEKIKEYGKDTVVLFQCGSFYELYEIDNNQEQIGNAKVISKILDMNYANKTGDTTKNSRTYPNFIGFTTSILSKYLSILLRNGFTVVVIDQLESSLEKKGKLVKRGITKIYSPSLNIDNNDLDINLVTILFDINLPTKTSKKKNSSLIQIMNVSICCINNNNNTTEITENNFTFLPNDPYTLNLTLENISRILYRLNPKELHIIFLNDTLNLSIEQIKNYFNDNYENTKYNNKINELYKNVNYQNTYLREIYRHINFGLIEPNEYFKLNNLSIINLIFILNFIGKHDISYIQNLTCPKYIIEDNFLILELNTLLQLNIINHKDALTCIFDIINCTKTAIGKRHLKNLLCKPFKDLDMINNRYTITESLCLLNVDVDVILNEILDIERLHRKMGISELHQYEFAKLDISYRKILILIEILRQEPNLKKLVLDEIFDNNCLSELNYYIKKYNETFDIVKMRKFSLNSGKDELENYFNKGIITELDIIQDNILKLESNRLQLRISFDQLINNDINKKGEFIKLVYTEFEGYSFTCTKIRYQTLLLKLNKQPTWKVKYTNNSVKFIPDELEKLSNKILSNRDLLSIKITINYKNVLLEYYRKYNFIFDKLKKLIEIIDVCNSNFKCSRKYNYVKPEIIKSNNSFIQAIQLRHPIIERLGKEYISNDILLDDTTNGMLLYGINSCGKSSLLRAIGVNLIMAQSGLFVACKSFKFSPFNTIISQVDLTDNLFSGKSSFITEMIGLKRILQCINTNTLVLCDELNKGTENNSSISLVSAVILELIKKNTKFFFTTHLHDIPKISDIIDVGEKLKVCHLSVIIKNDNIIYERKLKNGPGSDLYGLEVAKNLLEYPELIDKAFEIRNKLISNIQNIKKSTYNKKKIIDKCEICTSKILLETHHIVFQCNADSDGFLNKGIHKNHLSNLTILCKKCHDNVTYNRIIIHGYKDSTNGRFLDWNIN